jgi:hypothetical protein
MGPVYTSDADPGFRRTLFFPNAATAPQGVRLWHAASANLAVTNTNIIDGTVMRCTAVLNGASSSVGINGGTPVIGTTGIAATTNCTSFTMGCKFTKDYGWYNGDLAELIVFDTVLDASLQAKVEQYLHAKYNL